jgi:hypothetical protein
MSTFLIAGPALYQWIFVNFLLLQCRIKEQPGFYAAEVGEVTHHESTVAQDCFLVNVLYRLGIINIDIMLVL